MPRPRAKDLANAADRAAIAQATAFTVNRFLGRSGRDPCVRNRMYLWDRYEVKTLAEAVALRTSLGRDEHGRTSMIYAIAPDGRTVFVEPGWEENQS